ncbi:unnamed protein product, partial [Allacma fusca]
IISRLLYITEGKFYLKKKKERRLSEDLTVVFFVEP